MIITQENVSTLTLKQLNAMRIKLLVKRMQAAHAGDQLAWNCFTNMSVLIDDKIERRLG